MKIDEIWKEKKSGSLYRIVKFLSYGFYDDSVNAENISEEEGVEIVCVEWIDKVPTNSEEKLLRSIFGTPDSMKGKKYEFSRAYFIKNFERVYDV